jgi:hypothetical protein
MTLRSTIAKNLIDPSTQRSQYGDDNWTGSGAGKASATPPATVAQSATTAVEIDPNVLQQLEGLTILDLKARLDAMPPEERTAYEEAIFGNTDSSLNEANLDYGEELRGAEMPGMRQMGRLHQSANPLEFLAPTMDRIEGQKMRKSAVSDWEEQLARKEKARALRAQIDLAENKLKMQRAAEEHEATIAALGGRKPLQNNPVQTSNYPFKGPIGR